MEPIFLVFGQIVQTLGWALAIVTVGLLPIYVVISLIWRQKKTAPGKNLSTGQKMAIAFLVVLSTLFCAIISVTAVALGAWG